LCIDLETVTSIAKQHGILVTVDNTFATPYLQQPFKYGVEFVFHSTYQIPEWSGTAISGVLLGKNIDFMNTTFQKFFKPLDGNSSPFDAFLLMQGIKTLAVRMEKHCSDAAIVADFLAKHPAIAKVKYNALADHRDYSVSRNKCAMQVLC